MSIRINDCMLWIYDAAGIDYSYQIKVSLYIFLIQMWKDITLLYLIFNCDFHDKNVHYDAKM